MTFLEKLKIKLQNFSKSKQILLLDILDFLVDKGNMNIWLAISSKKFFQGLIDLLRTKDVPEVQMKLLGLIQKWGLNFENKKNALPSFFSVYNKLRMNNVQFPTNFESNYQVYIDENNINKNNYENNSGNEDNNNNNSDKDDDEIFYYMDSLKDVLKVPNFEHKYRRLVNFLVKMHDNIQMANLLIDNREHGGLKEIINTLRDGNNTLIDTIQGGRLKDEKLMEITLGTTEDINQTLGRDEDIKNGYKPNKFKSYFVINNVIRIKNNNHRNRAKSTKPKKNVQRNQEKYGMEDNFYNKNKYKEKMGPKNADDIFDLFSASNPNNEPQYYQNNNNRMNNNNANNINNFFNSPQTQQLRNNPMNAFLNSNNRNNNMMNNNRNNNTMFFNQNNNQYNNQQRPVMTNFDILEQKLNNLNLQQSQNNNYNNNYNNNFNNTNNNQNMNTNTPFNQGFNNNNANNNRNNNNLMNMLEQLGPGPQTNSNQLVPYIGSFNNQNNNNNMNQNNFMNNSMDNNQFNNNMNNNNQYNNMNNNQYNNMNNNINNNNQFNNSNNNQFNNRNMYNSQVINRGNNNMQINNNNNNQMNMNRINMSQNLSNDNNWMNPNNNQNNPQQMNFEEMQKQQRLKELDDLF